jgi:probable HAF family extracellular repeat protein
MTSSLLTLLALGSLSVPPAVQPRTAQYTVIDLGVFVGGGEAWAFGLNDAGQVAATPQYDEARRFFHAALWDGGTLTDLGQLSNNGFHSFATAVNESGHVVGGSPVDPFLGVGPDRAFLYDGLGMVSLGTLAGGNWSFAWDINDAGDVVGLSSIGEVFGTLDLTHAVLWSGGNIIDLGTLGGRTSTAHGINRSGQVVGASLLDQGPQHAFLWSGTMLDLGTLGGPSSEAWDINDKGQVVGTAQDPDGVRRAFLYEQGVMHDLGAPIGARVCEAYAINGAGQVVGTSWSTQLGPRAVLWQGAAAIDLNDRIDPVSPWTLQVARAVNAQGWIVGYGRLGGKTRAFLLMPSGG